MAKGIQMLPVTEWTAAERQGYGPVRSLLRITTMPELSFLNGNGNFVR